MVGCSLMSFLLGRGGGGEGGSSQELSFSGVISINRYFPNSFEQRHKSRGNFSGPTSNSQIKISRNRTLVITIVAVQVFCYLEVYHI